MHQKKWLVKAGFFFSSSLFRADAVFGAEGGVCPELSILYFSFLYFANWRAHVLLSVVFLKFFRHPANSRVIDSTRHVMDASACLFGD